MSTMVAPTGPSAVSAQNPYAAVNFGPKQRFDQLVRVELRKAVDTRSGKLLIAAIIALSAVALGWHLTHLPSGVVPFSSVLDTALVPVDLILPVIGILAMTSEWTQRTALTTFTLSPRRTPVLFAKLAAAVTLAVSLVVVVVGMAFAATALGGAIGGHGAVYDSVLRHIAGSGLADVLNVIMAASIGLVVVQTAVAVLGFYIAPTVWALVAPGLLHHNSGWLDIFNTFDQISTFDISGHAGQMATSLSFWIVAPAVLGLWMGNRREVK